jgi:hypothetical protein
MSLRTPFLAICCLISAAVPLYGADTNDLTWVVNGDGISITITDCDEAATGALVIPDTIEGKVVTSIGDDAFMDCASLASATIGNSVTSIGDYAFRDCTSLASATIGNSVTSIGYRAFRNCTSLTSITFEGNAPTFGATVFTGINIAANIYITPAATGFGGTLFGIAVIVLGPTPEEIQIAALEAQVAALETQVTALETAATSNATVIALLEQRPTLEEVQDARLGSVVLIKDEASGEINFDFNLEETEDLANWAPVVNGIWSFGGGGVGLAVPLAGDKRFYRVVVDFQ